MSNIDVKLELKQNLYFYGRLNGLAALKVILDPLSFDFHIKFLEISQSTYVGKLYFL